MVNNFGPEDGIDWGEFSDGLDQEDEIPPADDKMPPAGLDDYFDFDPDPTAEEENASAVWDDNEEQENEIPPPKSKSSNIIFYSLAGVCSLAVAAVGYFFLLSPQQTVPPTLDPIVQFASTRQPAPAQQENPPPVSPVMPTLGGGSKAANITPQPISVQQWAAESGVHNTEAPPQRTTRPGEGFELADGTVNRIGKAAADQVVSRLSPELVALRTGVRSDISPALSALEERVSTLADKIEQMEGKSHPTTRAVTPPATTTPRRSQATSHAAPAEKRLTEWTLKGISGQQAWVVGRQGSVLAIRVGDAISGAGRVTAIKRRGNHWIVVTTAGVIQQGNVGSASAGKTYVVQQGETWSGLLARTHTTASAWYAANPGLQRQISRKGWLYEGQRLTAPQT
jgi:LysM repeat protein